MSTPRVWFITGCSSGLGLDVVRHVLKRGDIAVATLRKPEVLASLKERYPPSRLLVLKVDVTVRSDITAAFERTREVFGRLDVVVSNAAYTVLGEIEGTPDDVARAMFEVNFWGATHVMQEAVKFFREVNAPGKGGRIIQITSATGLAGFPACGFYCGSKHATEGLADTLAKELDPEWNIKVTLIPLGAFVTNAVSNMVKLPVHPAYTKPDLPSFIYRQLVLANVKPEKGALLQGDPAKAAEAIYRLSELPSPPLRLALGKEALVTAREKIAKLSAEVEQYASWSDGLDKDE